MNIVLWVLQVVLAWLCIAGGFFQIFKFEDLRKGVAAMRELPRGVWAVLGAVGCLAGVGLILPAAFGVLPIVTAYSAVVVAAHSVLITGLYLHHGDRVPPRYSAAMAVLAAFIAYGRFALAPL
jgi:hypothetical protein